MTAAPVLRAASGGLTRRLVQTVVIFIVLAAATAEATLGLSLLTNANEAFQNAFTAHRGADIAISVDTARASSAQLAATRHVPGVTEMAGPYYELTITVQGAAPAGHPRGPGSGPRGPNTPGGPGGAPQSRTTVVGRATTGGRLDNLTLLWGHWLTGPGQIVFANYLGTPYPVGSKVTVVSAPGKPKLTVVAYAGSPGRFGEAWVQPSEIAALRRPHSPATAQMLYTFRRAATAPQIAADVNALKAALPAGVVSGYDSWLGSQAQTSGEQSVNTPFVLAFALIGLVLAVLIVASLVSGAVVASYQRIGVLKSIGFTPAQVAAAYLAQIGIPTVGGIVVGTVAGNLWVTPMLNVAASLFRVGAQHVPLWINVTVPVGMCLLVGLAALVPALRAGRLSTVQAITAGQAPRTGHGYAAHRISGRLPLPRPITVGLATPFTRPARTASSMVAIVFGATAVILAVGLNSSLNKIDQLASLGLGQVIAGEPKGNQGTLTAAQSRHAEAAIRAQPGTLRYVAEADNGKVINSISVPGLPNMNIVTYDGDSSWLGWPMVSGRWYTGPGEVDVNAEFLAETGLTVGDQLTLAVNGKPVRTQIVGQVYEANAPSLFTSWQTLGGTAAGVRATHFAIELRPGTSPRAYQVALAKALGRDFGVGVPSGSSDVAGPANPSSLIRLLTELIAILAGLGVLTSVLMLTRERVHDLGVFKALGMTPRQTVSMVMCWVITPAVIAAAIAIPAAIYVHAITTEGIGTITGSGMPASAITIYRPLELVLLALSGLLIAAIGALGPATWAAASRTNTALHTE